MPNIQKYKITNVQMRDEWQSKYGAMQDYAIALEGEEGWIKLSQKLETQPPQTGSEIEGYITEETNKNGNSYRKFKKESAEYANRGGGAPNVSGERLEYAIQMLEELTGRRNAPDIVSEPTDNELDDPFAGLNI